MKGKRILSFLLTVIMIVSMLGTFTIVASAETATTNVALGKTVKVSAGSGKAYINDGNKSDKGKHWTVDYGTTKTDAYFVIDLETPHEVEQFKIYNYYDSRYYNYEIYASIDGVNYGEPVAAKLKDVTANGTELETANGSTYTLENAVTARYIKVVMKSNCVTGILRYNYHVYEFEVYGRQTSVYSNVAKNKSVTVSDGTGAAYITDGASADKGKHWTVDYRTTPTDAYFIIDLEKVYSLKHFKIFNYYDNRYYNYEIYVSADGQDYGNAVASKIKDVTANGTENETASGTLYTLDKAVNARYVKVIMKSNCVAGTLIYNYHVVEFEAYGKEPVSYKAVAETNLALNKPVEVSENEAVNVLPPKYAVDGSHEWASRWSANYSTETIDNEEWIIVDLGDNYLLNKIDLDIQEAQRYQVLISDNGAEYDIVADVTTSSTSESTNVQRTFTFDTQPARYVKIHQLKARTGSKYWGMAIVEIEAYYSEEANMENQLNAILETVPVLSEDTSKIIPPSFADIEGYSVELFGSSNEAVIALDGTVYQPLEDMNVSLMYKIVKADDVDYSYIDHTKEVTITVPGKYTKEQGDNERPQVMPDIREWKGGKGEFVLSDSSRIVIGDKAIMDAAEAVQYYFSEMADIELEITTDAATEGDIVLALTDDKELGKEGYTADIGNIITVNAYNDTGLVYAGATLTQIVSNNGAVPYGIMRDYPAYEVRSCMLDVARAYIPLDYVEEITLYMAYYKMNELHLHINDNSGEISYAFRLESETYPAINSNLDGKYYSKESYRQYQKNVQKYGIDVVTEIDVPGHSGFASLYDSSYVVDGINLDVTNPEVLTFVKNIFNEYLDGDDPVIQSNKIHIGGDEYGVKTLHSEARDFINAVSEHVRAKGYSPIIWYSHTNNRLSYDNAPTNDNIIGAWVDYYSEFSEMVEAGYSFINQNHPALYIVPSEYTRYGFDYYNIESIWSSFEVNNLHNLTVPKSHPQLLGAEGCLWNDAATGFSEVDIFDRFRDQILIMAEKNWYGEKTSDQTADNFIQRAESAQGAVPGANPAREVKSDGDIIASYSFDENGNDNSKNGYHATLTNVEIKDGCAVLDKEGYISLPFGAVGNNYTASFRFFLNKDTDENAVLFEGKDSVIYANYKGTGCIGYERKGYNYILDYVIPENEWVNVTLTCDNDETILLIDGIEVARGKYHTVTISGTLDSSSVVLPVEKIGAGISGMIDDLVITTNFLEHDDIVNGSYIGYKNLAEGKDVTASGYLLDDTCHGNRAVDGKFETSVLLNNANDAWMTVDLGDVATIDRIEIEWFAKPNKFSLMASDDNSTWTAIHTNNACRGQFSGYETILLDKPVAVRYIRYQQTEMYTSAKSGVGTQSGSISELKVFGFEKGNAISSFIENATAAVGKVTVTDENRLLVEKIQASISLMSEIKNCGNAETLGIVASNVAKSIDALENGNYATEDTDTSVLRTALLQDTGDSTTARIAWSAISDSTTSQSKLTKLATSLINAVVSSTVSNIALGKPASASSCEVDSLSADLAVDGNSEEASRWSANYSTETIDNEEWLIIDLENVYNVNRIVMDLYECQKYNLLVSTDGIEYTTVASVDASNSDANSSRVIKTFEFEEIPARYVKFHQLRARTGSKYWGAAIVELEVYGASTDTNKNYLINTVATFEALDTSSHKLEGKIKLKEAIADAKAVIDDPSASQTKIEGALKKLSAAYAMLEKVTVPEIQSWNNNAILAGNARRVYWGYIGTENTEYKWFADFKAECGDTFTSEYSPKANDTYELTRKGFYRFVVNEDGKDYVYTVECTVDSAPAVDMSAENAVATLSGNARKVYFGYIGEENTAYAGFAPFKESCGDTFTADFSPRDNKAYRMEKEGYYRFVVNYLDQNGKSHDKVFTFKCENAGYGIPEVTYADGKITLSSNEAKVNKMYIGYFGEETTVSDWEGFVANAKARACVITPADNYETELKNEGCYVILVNYTDENGKMRDKYFTFIN